MIDLAKKAQCGSKAPAAAAAAAEAVMVTEKKSVVAMEEKLLSSVTAVECLCGEEGDCEQEGEGRILREVLVRGARIVSRRVLCAVVFRDTLWW